MSLKLTPYSKVTYPTPKAIKSHTHAPNIEDTILETSPSIPPLKDLAPPRSNMGGFKDFQIS